MYKNRNRSEEDGRSSLAETNAVYDRH